MSQGFWSKLNKPIMAMAPMANVTDAAFRRMFAELGKPDVFWTEFVSVEGLLSRGREKLMMDFWHSDEEHPIVAQIFGSKPEQFEEVAAQLAELGFDGIDINMGCPDSGVEKSGAGAGLIKNPELAREIIRATKRGAARAAAAANAVKISSGESAVAAAASEKSGVAVEPLPVSVKTRIGYKSPDEMTAWLTALLEEDLAALTVHLRTRNEMSDVPARWELAPQIAALRNKIAPQTLILGNGDVASLEEARTRTREGGIDGVMIGRGMFGNPWFFNREREHNPPTLRERLERLVKHAELFEELYKTNLPRRTTGKNDPRPLKGFEIMKKHFKSYSSGFDDAKELRIKLMETENAAQVRAVTEEFLKTII